jgi:HPr kinase/phosphorylase
LGEHESCPLPSISVRELLEETAEPVQLALVAGGDGLDNALNRATVQKPGLALTGFLEYIHAGMIQILGKAEISYLAERPSAERSRILSQLCRQGGTCFVVTSGMAPPDELVAEAERHAVPLLKTELPTSPTIESLTRYLEDKLAPRVVIHGVLLDIYGLGVLLLGESGIGKSECALDLVVRGHRLISDDVVEMRRRKEVLVGTGPELTRYHMELRGVGIINVKDLFGVAAVRMNKYVEYVIKLDPWKADKRYDRLGLDERSYEILGVELPYVEMPVGPGRNLSVLIEVAARNQLLKRKGYHPARELARMLNARLQRRASDVDEASFPSAAPLARETEDGEA